jgi:hypothetical protein
MLARLHRRLDAVPDPWRDVIVGGVALLLTAALAQPWSRELVLAAVFVLAVLLASRVRYLEGR